VRAPFISFLSLYDSYIQDGSNKRVINDFLDRCTKILLKLGISARFEGRPIKLLEQKQLRIDTDILHPVGLEFDVNFENQIKNGSSSLIFSRIHKCNKKLRFLFENVNWKVESQFRDTLYIDSDRRRLVLEDNLAMQSRDNF